MNQKTSRIANFYKLSVPERLDVLLKHDLITEPNYQALKSGYLLLNPAQADKMIENVIGVIGLPVGLALNFIINQHEYVIPMAIEEPSVVAALSSAAKIARSTGGFLASMTEPILIGQIQVVSVPDQTKAEATLLACEQQIIDLANSLHPRMVARGGGAKSLEVRTIETKLETMLIVHLLVDTQDAMGANLVNTMCEGVAPLVEKLTGGRVFLRILSNLTDRCVVRAKMRVATKTLETKKFTGIKVRDGIISAAQFAAADPYRAATHNKGIMNGIDAVAIATGNDWRALESAAHSYAARSGHYRALTHFYTDASGDLVGEIEIPIKVGTVGASLQSNPIVGVNLALLGTKSARTLAEIMGAVGLAQNFSALRALATEGIQQGHMTLHARSVATAAKVPTAIFDQVVTTMINEEKIKVWNAERIAARLTKQQHLETQQQPAGQAFGKIILLGEHAAVYGRRVLAAPVPLAITAEAERPEQPGVELLIPDWKVHFRTTIGASPPETGYGQLLMQIMEALELTLEPVRILVRSAVPRSMGLGSSAAFVVTIIRVLDGFFKLKLSDEQVNDLAYTCESRVHGNASGVDNTVATYGKFILFKKSKLQPEIEPVSIAKPLYFILASTGIVGETSKSVAMVREKWKNNNTLYNGIFNEMEKLTNAAVTAIGKGATNELGELMNLAQGYLNGLQVSSPELERLIHLARSYNALGAKLTGGGLGGTVLNLCANAKSRQDLGQHLNGAGYETINITLESQ